MRVVLVSNKPQFDRYQPKVALEEAEKQLIQRQIEIMQTPEQTSQNKRNHQFELMANEYGDNEAINKFPS